MPIYLDYNATAPVRPQAIEKMNEILAVPANGSSVHSYGRIAKKHLEEARKLIADSLSIWTDELVFCGSATEANNWVMRAFAGKALVSAIEHSSIASHQSPVASVNSDGLIDLTALEAMLTKHRPTLVSVMLANNETGVIQPIGDISALCKKHGVLLHSDAVQGIGKLPVDVGALGVDLMTISGHKCGGPVGTAALVIRRGVEIPAFMQGGGQEMRKRAGTENIAAIAGFAKAVELIDLGHMQKLRGWLDAMEERVQRPELRGQVVGKESSRLPNTSCIIMPGVGQEVQLMDFDIKGFAVSAGSACSSGRIEPSHVLLAMGISPEWAGSAIRVSGGWATTEKDISDFTEAWISTCERLATKTR